MIPELVSQFYIPLFLGLYEIRSINTSCPSVNPGRASGSTAACWSQMDETYNYEVVCFVIQMGNGVRDPKGAVKIPSEVSTRINWADPVTIKRCLYYNEQDQYFIRYLDSAPSNRKLNDGVFAIGNISSIRGDCVTDGVHTMKRDGVVNIETMYGGELKVRWGAVSVLPGAKTRRMKREEYQCSVVAYGLIVNWGKATCDFSSVREEIEKAVKRDYDTVKQEINDIYRRQENDSDILNKLLVHGKTQLKTLEDSVNNDHKHMEVFEKAMNGYLAQEETMVKQQNQINAEMLMEVKHIKNLIYLVDIDAKIREILIALNIFFRTNSLESCDVDVGYVLGDPRVATSKLADRAHVLFLRTQQLHSAIAGWVQSTHAKGEALIKVLNSSLVLHEGELKHLNFSDEGVNLVESQLNKLVENNGIRLSQIVKSSDIGSVAGWIELAFGIIYLIMGICVIRNPAWLPFYSFAAFGMFALFLITEAVKNLLGRWF